jgi:dienelactone hydrolase
MIHPVDRAAAVVVGRGPSRLRFFADGWGDPDLLGTPDISIGPTAPITPSWTSREVNDSGHIVRFGNYDAGDRNLPIRSQIGAVQSIEPDREAHRTVLLMAAWNEHDPTIRVAIAERLADQGIRSIIPENPFYGSRHPNPESHQPIRTVSDFMQMGLAAVTEAKGLLTGMRESGHELGVSGYSMGGNVAAIISATLDFPIATAPLAASHSPGPVFLDGALKAGIAWDALGGIDQHERLRAVLNSVSVLRVPPQEHLSRAVIVAGRSDGYIPMSATRALVDHWPGSELRVHRGGHATLVWYRKAALTSAIVASFDRMSRAS